MNIVQYFSSLFNMRKLLLAKTENIPSFLGPLNIMAQLKRSNLSLFIIAI